MNISKLNWIRSLAVNAVILVTILLCTYMAYETNDDYAIASRIVDAYPAVNFVNYYLCLVLVALQKLVPALNMYVIAQIACSFVSFVCIYKIILDGSRNRVIHIAAAAVIALFSFDHYCTIQFTKTAAVLLIAGTMLMMDSIANKRSAVYYILSVVLLYTGAAFRIDGLIAAAGFAGLYLLKWLFDNRRELISEGYFTAGRIALYVLLIALIGGCYGFDRLSSTANRSTPELKTYKEYSILRSAVVDYPLYEYYDNNAAAYAAAGISENDLNLIDHWYFDYDGAASAENLEKIIEVDGGDSRPSYSIDKALRKFFRETRISVRKLDFTGIHLIMLAVIAIWMLISLRPRHWIYIFAAGGLAAAMYLALYYMQRPQYRALYIADLGAAMWLLYSAGIFHERDEQCTKGRSRRTLVIVMGVCTALTALMLIFPLRGDCSEVRAKAERRIMPDKLAEYIRENDDTFFVFGTQEKKSVESYLTPWKPADTYSERNMMGTGSWGSMSPYVLGKLEAYGMTNPIRDLIDNDRACYVGNKRISRLTEYYNKWYGSDDVTIYMEKTGRAGGLNIWKVRTRSTQNGN